MFFSFRFNSFHPSATFRSRRKFQVIPRIEQLETRALPTSVTLRIAVYNIASADGAPRAGLDTILQAIGNEATYGAAQPIDVLALQEVNTQASTTQNVVNLLNAIYGPNFYSRGTLNGSSTGAGTQGLVYRTSTVQLVGEHLVPIPAVNVGGTNYSAERQPIRYQLLPVGASASDTFYIYNSHYKANPGTSDQNQRQAEATNIRADADALGQGKNILYVGDFNSYASTETFYSATLMGPGNGQAFDPINRSGAWHSSPASFVSILTQAPSSAPPGGLTGGGLDDRFDFQLNSGELADGAGLEYKVNTYHTFGNNGSVAPNGNINNPNSTALPGLANRTTVLNLLTTVSDHLPVVADYTLSIASGPTIGAFAVAPTSILIGDPITLTASNVAATTGSIASVNFYRESNGVTGLQIGADTLVGPGAQGGSTWTLAANSTGLTPGGYTYYAVATDSSNNASAAASASLTIGNPVTSGPILAWNVNGQTNYGVQGLAAGLVAAGISNSLGLTRGSGVGTTNSGASGGWGGNAWAMTSAAGITGNDFATFGFTVAAGKSVSLSSLDMNYRHSGTGPANGFWQFQVNNGDWTTIGDFPNQFPDATSAGAAMTELNLAGVASLQNLAAGSIVNLRVIPYGATTTGGTWYVFDLAGNDLVLNGAIQNATSTILTATPNATTGGSLVTFTATVSPSPGAAGSVSFLDAGAAVAGGSNVALFGGVATLQISTLTLGSHPITAVYSGATGFTGSTSNTLNFAVATTPQVVSVTVNGNLPAFAGPQRSRVVSLQVVFDRAVQLDANAFAIALHTNNVNYNGTSAPFGVVPANLILSTDDNATWVVTFAGNTDPSMAPADGFHSLKDGVYDFHVVASQVHPYGLPSINAVANSTTVFDRLFGDTDGAVAVGNDFSTTIDTFDSLAFRNAFNTLSSVAGSQYLAYLDFDGDGQVNTTDNLQFRNRFNKPLSWRD